jgi:hypothetical protein
MHCLGFSVFLDLSPVSCQNNVSAGPKFVGKQKKNRPKMKYKSSQQETTA